MIEQSLESRQSLGRFEVRQRADREEIQPRIRFAQCRDQGLDRASLSNLPKRPRDPMIHVRGSWQRNQDGNSSSLRFRRRAPLIV